MATERQYLLVVIDMNELAKKTLYYAIAAALAVLVIVLSVVIMLAAIIFAGGFRGLVFTAPIALILVAIGGQARFHVGEKLGIY